MTGNAKRTPIASQRSSARRRCPFPQAISAHDSMSPAKVSRTNRPGPQLSERSDADETQPTVVARPRTRRGRARNDVNGLGSGSRCRRTSHGTTSMVSAAAAGADEPRTEPRQWSRQRQPVQTNLARNHIDGLDSGSRYSRTTHETTSMISPAAACAEGFAQITSMVAALRSAVAKVRQQQRPGTKRPPRSRNHIHRPWPPTPR